MTMRREGDWDCPNCGGVVDASKNECWKCRKPKPSGMEGSGGRYGLRDPGYYDRGGMFSRTQDQNSRALPPPRDVQQRDMQQTGDRDAWDPKGAEDAMQVEKQAVESTVLSEPKLPHPWQQRVSSRTGKFYWYNPDTKETTWNCPTPILQVPLERH